VYCDPPYDAGFVAYTKAGFSWQQQRQLAHWALRASQRGARVIVSNADTERIRTLYAAHGFTIYEIEAGRSISCDGTGRGAVGELLMVRDETL
jgi:site-specific DNA-adenine methylase